MGLCCRLCCTSITSFDIVLLMSELVKSDLVGKRIVEIVVSQSDHPADMSGPAAYCASYVRLETGVLFSAEQPCEACVETLVEHLKRDKTVEKKLRPILQEEITNVVVSTVDGSIYIVTKALLLTVVPGQFWVGPVIMKPSDLHDETESYWPG
jgi:hypothetical protein